MSRNKLSLSGPAFEADPRIPFPYSPAPTACCDKPGLFDGDLGPDVAARIEQAKATCRSCPIATECLKWALANPNLTTEGIWGATTPYQRTTLRRQLTARLGKDWVGIIADADRKLAELVQHGRVNRSGPAGGSIP